MDPDKPRQHVAQKLDEALVEMCLRQHIPLPQDDQELLDLWCVMANEESRCNGNGPNVCIALSDPFVSQIYMRTDFSPSCIEAFFQISEKNSSPAFRWIILTAALASLRRIKSLTLCDARKLDKAILDKLVEQFGLDHLLQEQRSKVLKKPEARLSRVSRRSIAYTGIVR